MAKKWRVGIVGCGGIARAHVKAWEANAAAVAALFDVQAKSAEALAGEVGGKAEIVASINEMAKRDDLDAVSICTPPGVHLQNCRPFLKAKTPILCEKPMEADAAKAGRLARAVRKARVPFMVALCHRFHPPVIKLKELIKEGVLGKPLMMRNIFAGMKDHSKGHRANPELSGGGVMVDNGAHAADLFRFLVGEPTHVCARVANLQQKMPVEDFSHLQLEIKGRVFGELISSWSLPMAQSNVELYGTKGMAVISYFDPSHPDLCCRTESNPEWRTVDCGKLPDRFAGEVAHFMESVKKKRKPAVNEADGLAASRILTAAYRAAKENRRVAVRLK